MVLRPHRSLRRRPSRSARSARSALAIGLGSVVALGAGVATAGSNAGGVQTASTTPDTTEPTVTTPASTTTLPAPAVPDTTTPAPPPVATVAADPDANHVAVDPTSTPLVAVGGADGAETQRIQRRLLELGFWLQNPNGNYDLTTLQAVMAFQKYLGLDASGSVDAPTAAMMSGLEVRAYGYADAGTLVEIDKTRQLLFIVVDGKVRWVLNTSTGNGEEYAEEDQNTPGTIVEGISLTPDGLHKVERERPEGWWEGDLGQIYRPKYFIGGVAVHGSNSVPNYPASHGCVRVTTAAMDFIWESGLMPMQMPVWVHENPRQPFPTP